MNAAELSQIVGMVVPISVCVVLPVLVLWLTIRKRINIENARKEIIIAAIEKNPNLDIEQCISKIKPKERLLKEKLLGKLLWGTITSLVGLTLVIAAMVIRKNATSDATMTCAIFGGVFVSVGISFLANFFIGRRMLSKEIKTEEEMKADS